MVESAVRLALARVFMQNKAALFKHNKTLLSMDGTYFKMVILNIRNVCVLKVGFDRPSGCEEAVFQGHCQTRSHTSC